MLYTRPRLTIDLRLVQENFATLASLAPSAKLTAVIKANAYGLGSEQIAPALTEAGCDTFWVAHPFEAIPVRKAAPQAVIYVLNGLGEDYLDLFRDLNLRPVLNTLSQLALWQKTPSKAGPAALMIDTGLNRLGLRGDEAQIAAEHYASGKLNIGLLCSHLACADIPEHPLNEIQLARFDAVKKLFPDLKTSFVASYGVFLDKEYHHDVIRAGRGLFGIKTASGRKILTQPVLRVSAPVLQIATVAQDASVGYRATWQANMPRRIATLAVGYADGVPFQLQNHGHVYFTAQDKTYAAPIVGRISMDLMDCDVTDVPEEIAQEGAWADLITREHYADEMGENAQTICYEIITRLGPRFERAYKSA